MTQTIELIDTHVHVNFDTYNEDREEMMARAYESGVKSMVHACTCLSDIPELIELSQNYNGEGKPNLFFAIGIHPTETSDYSKDVLETLEEKIEAELAKPSPKLKAIGETGLDYFHVKDEEGITRQRQSFKDHINLAKKYRLPLIVHTRDAWEDTLEILSSEFPQNPDAQIGVLHCYTGDSKFAKACIELGFYVSWSGIVTFKNSALREVAKELPLEKTLVETDCPFLSPQAKRGKRNEPEFVNYVAEHLAEVFGMPFEDFAALTTANAKALFNI